MARTGNMQVYDLAGYHQKIRREKPELPLKDRALTIREVCDKTGVSRSTIFRWIREGYFPNGKRFGKRSVRWLESRVDAWIESREG